MGALGWKLGNLVFPTMPSVGVRIMASETRSAGAASHSNIQKGVALLFGVVLALVGVSGFVSELVIDGKVLGIFGITPLHNVVHLLSGSSGWPLATTLRVACSTGTSG